jgi:hypothetical protein
MNENISVKKFIESGKKLDKFHLREEVSFETLEYEDVTDFNSIGWTYKRINNGYIVRAPEQWLVDLTDPYKVSACIDFTVNLAFYNFIKYLVKGNNFESFLKEVIKNNDIQGLVVQYLQGPSLETEIRIAGSDNRVKNMQKLSLLEAMKNPDWQIFHKQAVLYLENIRLKNFDKRLFPIGVEKYQQFYMKVNEYLGKSNKTGRDLFILEFIPGLFNDVPQFDLYVFVLWSSLRYIPSFLTDDNISKIMFWDPYYGNINFPNRILNKNIIDKRILIIDTSYSGGTLKYRYKTGA